MGFGYIPGQTGGGGGSMTAVQIRDALQTLLGGNRLDASAIKNLYGTTLPGSNLVYASDGDINGLAYYLGTAGLTTAFTNPAVNTAFPVIASSELNPGSFPTSSIVDRIPSLAHTQALTDSWFAFSIPNNSLSVTKYTLRARNDAGSNQLRSWILEGTNTLSTFTVAGVNAASWAAIDTRTNDATLNAADQYYTLTKNGTSASFRYLRLKQTSPNSSGTLHLTLGEIEFYGTLS